MKLYELLVFSLLALLFLSCTERSPQEKRQKRLEFYQDVKVETINRCTEFCAPYELVYITYYRNDCICKVSK